MNKTKKAVGIILRVGLGLVLLALIYLAIRVRPPDQTVSPGMQGVYPGPGETDEMDASMLAETAIPYPAPGQEATQIAENDKQKPPFCDFSTGNSEQQAPNEAPVNLQFSEPRIIFSSETGIGIAGWLPDGKRLLLTRDTAYGSQIIETFNIISGESQIYAERHYAGGKPIWIEELNAVAFTTFVQDHEELWVSYGDPNQTEQLFPDVYSLSLTKFGGNLLFFSPSRGDQLLLLDINSKSAVAFGGSLNDLAYSNSSALEMTQAPGYTFQIAIQPSQKNIIYFGSALLFSTSIDTQETCEIELGSGNSGPNWASMIQWNNEGRFLAIVLRSGNPGSLENTNKIMILDTSTGEKYFPEMETPFIYDYVWSPDQNVLLALGKTGVVDGRAKMGLFLIDVNAKTVSRLFPDLFFGGGGIGKLAWIDNEVALDCTSWPQNENKAIEGRVCSMNITQGE